MDFTFSDDFLNIFQPRKPNEVRGNNVPNGTQTDDQLKSNKETNLVKIENHDVPVEEGLVNSEKQDNIKNIPPIFAQTAEMTTTKHDLKKLSEVTTLPPQSKNESDTIANNKLYSNSSSSSQTLVKKCRKSTGQSLSTEIPKVESQMEPNLESTDNPIETLNNLMSKEECHSTENDNIPTLDDPYVTEDGGFLNGNGVTLTETDYPSTSMASLTTEKSSEKKFVVHEIHLNRQDNIHTKNKRFTCGLCKVLFLRCSWFLDHSETMHKHCHLCAVCGDEFVEGDLLWQHHKDIHGEKHFACNICGLLTNKRRLKRHEKSHHVKQHYLMKKEVISVQDTPNIDTKEDISNNIDHIKNEKIGRSSNLPPIDSHRILSSKNKLLIATEDEKPTNAENIYVTSAVKMEFNDEIVQNEIKMTTGDDCKFSAENKIGYTSLQDKKCKSSKEKSGRKDLYCEACNKTFSRFCNWDFHMKRHSKEEPNSTKSETNHQCACCDKMFLDLIELKDHIRIHTGKRPFQCSFCEKSFAKKSILVIHKRIHTGEKPFTCESCGESFIQSYMLKRHSTMFCEKKFESADILKNRKKVSDHQAKYQCSYCNKSFPTLSRLKSHEESHTGERPFSCDICGLRLSQKKGLRRHLLAKHNIKSPLNNADKKDIPANKSGCVNDEIDQANLTFPVPPWILEPSKGKPSIVSIRQRKYNLWIEDNIKQYQCLTCKREFQDVTVLPNHVCVASDKKKSFRCSFCGKSLSKQLDLKNHIRTHTGEKPFRCETCGISYSIIDKLKQHERKSHVRSRCNICKKEFVTKHLLKEHNLLEHGGNQFVCKTCGKEFKMLGRLIVHGKIHNVKNLFCYICGMKFITKDFLQNHLAKHTQEKSLVDCYEQENSSENEEANSSKKPAQILEAENNSESIGGKRKLKSQPNYNIPNYKMKKYEHLNR